MQAVVPSPAISSSDAAKLALEYISRKYALPIDVLSVLTQHSAPYQYLGRTFEAIVVQDTSPYGRVFKTLVDVSNGEVTEDVSGLRQQEQDARQVRFGKLEPRLYEKLETLNESDKLPVIIWMISDAGRSQSEREKAAAEKLAQKYPEAKKAMENSGKPMDVENPELAQQIYNEYVQLMRENVDLNGVVVSEIERSGTQVMPIDGMNAFAAVLPKRAILNLEKHGQVGQIFLNDVLKQNEMDIAARTDRAAGVWNRGIVGSGVNLGVLDTSNVDAANPFLHISSASRPGNSSDEHASDTASVAASFHDTYKGIAPGATIISIGENGQQNDEITALDWAFQQNVHVLNNSGGFQSDRNVNFIDAAFDKKAREVYRLIVNASGNTGNFIRSPGKAWNVLTVGSFDDKNTRKWAGDTMSSFSAFINPNSPHNDREKPELVAVGENVTVWNHNANTWVSCVGTSCSAPMVSGLGALLIQRHSQLLFWPEASRAIMLATAFHNIEGSSSIMLSEDARDGAGGIDAGKADLVATTRCNSINSSCGSRNWWGFGISNTGPQTIDRYFTGTAGKRVRVAIAWWSSSDCSLANPNCSDDLRTDLDLQVFDPSGNVIPGGVAGDVADEMDGGAILGSVSASWDNNYELADFVTPTNGTYRIRITIVSMNESGNNVGMAVYSQ